MKLMPLCCAFVIAIQANAQSGVDTIVKLKDALQIAEQHYHALQALKYESDAADKNTAVARYSRFPSIDATYQAGVGTANNLIGMFYPYGILPITGPPSSGNNYSPATGSAVGVLLNWQAITFGQRNAQIDLAVTEAGAKKSAWQRAIFDHKLNVISYYLDVLLAQENKKIHEQNILRVQADLKQSRVLAGTGIKPGVDTALFLSELSKARIDSLQADRQLLSLQFTLQQLLVISALPLPGDSIFLHELPARNAGADTSFAKHPLIVAAQQEYQVSQSKELLLRKSYLPKLNIWGAGFARGSGFLNNGDVKTWDGLGLSRYNYSAGLQLAFPILKYGEVRQQLAAQQFSSRAAVERVEENKATLSAQLHIADATFNSSLSVAIETKQQLSSAQYAFRAMQIRYNTGLANFSDLIQAQYNLLKGELDVKRAYYDAWKALLLEAAVAGDESVFINQIK